MHDEVLSTRRLTFAAGACSEGLFFPILSFSLLFFPFLSFPLLTCQGDILSFAALACSEGVFFPQLCFFLFLLHSPAILLSFLISFLRYSFFSFVHLPMRYSFFCCAHMSHVLWGYSFLSYFFPVLYSFIFSFLSFVHLPRRYSFFSCAHLPRGYSFLHYISLFSYLVPFLLRVRRPVHRFE